MAINRSRKIWQALKRWWSVAVRFIQGHSVEDLIESIRRLIQHVIENGLNSGNILIRVLSIPFLIVLISFLGVILGIKKIFKNFFKIIKNAFRFLNKLITAVIKEIDFYWELAANTSKGLVETEKYLINKLTEYSKYLLRKIKNDEEQPYSNYRKGYFELLISMGKQFIAWLLYLFLALFMSVTLSVLPILVPLSSRLSQKYLDRTV